MKLTYLLLTEIILVFSACQHKTTITLYDAPEEIKPSSNYRVNVNGKPAFVYDVKVAFDDKDPEGELESPDMASFISFDFSGKIEVTIYTPDEMIKEVIVRPFSLGIIPKTNGNKILFTLTHPCKLSVEVNGKINNNLMIFANSPSTPPPDIKDLKVLYFGPGIHEYASEDNKEGILKLKSNQTVYLDGGAILRARIDAENCENVKITGRGIIDGSTLSGRWPDYLSEIMKQPKDEPRGHLVEFRNAKNIHIEGVVLLDAPCFALSLLGCSDVFINDLKIIGYVPNSDGINPCNSREITINDVFIRTGDDCIAIKGYNWFDNAPDVKNIQVKNSILWADRASALEIGHETGVNEIYDIYFSNIDILQQSLQTMGYHAIDITGVDNAIIHDIHYDNIRIERCSRLIGLRINRSKWSASKELGKIENVYFNSIVSYVQPDIYLFGYDSLHSISNIVFKDLYSVNNPNDTLPSIFYNKYVNGVKIIRNDTETGGFISGYPANLAYQPVDISAMCNRTRSDYKKGDHVGWLDSGPDSTNNFNEKDLTLSNDMSELKGGLHSFGDIPFTIIEENDHGSVVMLSSHENLTYLPEETKEIKINSKARFIFFLQTSAFDKSELNEKLWYYKIRYADSSCIHVPVHNKTDVGDWKLWSMAGWQYSIGGARIYVMPWKNPKPDRFIASVKMVSTSPFEIPILFAMTLGK